MSALEALVKRWPWAAAIVVVLVLAFSDDLLASVVALGILILLAMLVNYFRRSDHP